MGVSKLKQDLNLLPFAQWTAGKPKNNNLTADS